MKRSRFTGSRIIAILKQAEAGTPVSERCWEHGIYGECFINREMIRTTVFNYIECDYNRWRRYRACGDLTPEQFENQNLA